MWKIDDPTAVGSQPSDEAAGTEGWFTEGAAGVTPATRVRMSWLNMIQAEIGNVVDSASLSHSKSNDAQLLEAIRFLIGQGLPGVIGGLGATMNTGDLLHDIDFAGGAAASADATTILRAAPMTKRMDANWVAGNGNGGLGNGLTMTANTWYHEFVVNKTDGGVDFGWDVNPAATNLLALTGGSKYRMIGSRLTKPAAAEITPFNQSDDWCAWVTPPLDHDDATLGQSRKFYALSVPPDIRSIVRARIVIQRANTCLAVVGDPIEADQAPSVSAAPLNFIDANFTTSTMTGILQARTNDARQIYARAAATDTTIRIATLGFFHPRGRWA